MEDIYIPVFDTDPPQEFFEWIHRLSGMTRTKYNRLFPETRAKLYRNWLRTQGGQSHDTSNAGTFVSGRS